MKIIKSIIWSLVCLVSFTSCTDWLDINVDPNTPTAESATVEARLAHCEFYMNSAYQFGGMHSYLGMGDMTMSSRTSTHGSISQWLPTNGVSLYSYQWFFVGAAPNLQDLYEKAIEQGAYHYAGASCLIHAYGFMLMTDLYGEMPYTEALGESALPKYDTGKTIFLGCLAKIDEAIELFQQAQGPAAPSLSIGDSWNNGDVNKWLKMAYLLKARWINHLSKKEAGSYKEGKWDANEILACLAKAHSSINDNTVYNHTDDNGPTTDNMGWGEPVDYAPLHSVLGSNPNYFTTKMFIDNLTNFAGNNVEDPRADKLIPWAYSQKSSTSPEGLKWNGSWRRSVGVDMHTLIRLQSAPYASSFSAEKAWYCDSTDPERQGDTIYINMMSGAKGYLSNKDLLHRKLASDDRSASSGGFYIRPSSPTYIATYHEACFIKAEVLFKQGNASGAFEAYKEGIKASIDAMNLKLQAWCSEDETLKRCPSFTTMEQADIEYYLTNGIGTAGDLTLGKIMTQKRMAMLFSIEIFNDMRRYDYSEEIFLNWEIPAEYYVNADAQKVIPLGQQLRRFRQCSHETNYNKDNLQAIGSQVPGANMDGGALWNLDDAVWTINVWWDSNQQ